MFSSWHATSQSTNSLVVSGVVWRCRTRRGSWLRFPNWNFRTSQVLTALQQPSFKKGPAFLANLKLWGGATCFAYQCGFENRQVSQNDTWTFIQELSHSSVEHDWTWPRFCSETHIGSTRSAIGLRQRLQRLISAESLTQGENLETVGATSCDGVSCLRLQGEIIHHVPIVSYCPHHYGSLWDMLCYNMLQYLKNMIWHTSTRAFVVDFTSASQGFAFDQRTIVFCFCFCSEFRNFLSKMAIFGVLICWSVFFF